jgi:hypothetical protein
MYTTILWVCNQETKRSVHVQSDVCPTAARVSTASTKQATVIATALLKPTSLLDAKGIPNPYRAGGVYQLRELLLCFPAVFPNRPS